MSLVIVMRADDATIALTRANIEIISGYFDANEVDQFGLPVRYRL
jgi:hypothetical protein